MSLAILFPGQGSQSADMLHTLPASPAVDAVLEESSSQLEHLGLVMPLDTSQALGNTTNAQLALLIAGVACARAITVDHGLMPQFVAGHSVGAFAAAVTAGVLTLSEALAAVTLRGRLMEQACAQGDWGMAAVTGLPIRLVCDLVERVRTDDEPLWVANVNSATQTVLSGTVGALHRAGEAAEGAGARDYERLAVAVASHCPIQDVTARRLAEHLTPVPRRELGAQYVTNTRGRVTSSAEIVIDDLARGVAHPVQWYDATRLMAELGVTCAIEVQPGHVLARLLSSEMPAIAAMALQDNGITTVVGRARRHL